MKILLTISALCFVFGTTTGQLGFQLGGGAESNAMARTSATIKGAGSVLNNQATMVDVTSWAFTANASRRYNISGLDVLSFGAIYHSTLGHLGLVITQYGYEGYKEQKIGIAYAKKISSGTSIGIQADWMNLSLLEFGNSSFFTAEIGIYSELSENIHLGAHIFSPAGIAIDDEYDIPTRITIGPKFIISDNLEAYAEIEKVIDLDPAFKAAIAYKIQDQLTLRLGVIPSQSEYSFGFSYNFDKAVSVDGSFMYDQRLGTSPGVGIQYIKQ
jgi:hypothetical protein